MSKKLNNATFCFKCDFPLNIISHDSDRGITRLECDNCERKYSLQILPEGNCTCLVFDMRDPRAWNRCPVHNPKEQAPAVNKPKFDDLVSEERQKEIINKAAIESAQDMKNKADNTKAVEEVLGCGHKTWIISSNGLMGAKEPYEHIGGIVECASCRKNLNKLLAEAGQKGRIDELRKLKKVNYVHIGKAPAPYIDVLEGALNDIASHITDRLKELREGEE